MMRYRILMFVAMLYGSSLFSQQVSLPGTKTMLPNGWSLTPAGKQLSLGDLPLNMAVSTSKKYLAVTNNGQSTQSIELFDAQQQLRLDSITIPKSWYGLVFGKNDQYLYVSGGNDNRILVYKINNSKLHLHDSIILDKKWPVKVSPAGIAVDHQQHQLYVVTKENNSLYIIDLQKNTILSKLPLGAEAYTCLFSPKKNKLYISVWGGEKILCYNTLKQKITDSIHVGSHPNEMVLSHSGKYLFVANADDNTVSVINTNLHQVIETLNTALYPNAPTGSTTNGVALSEDGHTLYVANADNNCLAVFDVAIPGKSFSKGFIPVGWYPTNVKVIGKNIFVTNGKGLQSFANPLGPNPASKSESVWYHKADNTVKGPVEYIAGMFKGSLSIIPEPDKALLALYSQQVYQNTPYNKYKELHAEGEAGNPIPAKVGDTSPIKYVFYIIKENRTYDQVLGDMPEGNGDTSLVLFGEKITPNQHALARQFVLLDNFYCDAEVSADGHNWSLGAYANDYLEKTWPTSYGGRGGSYDAEGKRPIANNKNGFIWSWCKKQGISYRTYGEFADDYKPNIPVLKNHICPYFTGWDMYVRDTSRVTQWKRDFDSLVAIHQLPQFNTLRLITDHTEGMKLGRPSPFAHVADNDLAVGLFIEHLSHSAVWNQSVVFIVEDDAQNGPDHVDAHRAPVYVISPFIKRGFVDHTMYSTSSVLRTIELILGLPPMSQYDAAATPLWRSFTNQTNYTPYQHIPSNVDLDEINVHKNRLSMMSQHFDFTKEDRVPEEAFNEVLWKGIKGLHTTVPKPMRAAFVLIPDSGKKDAD
ncbi:MAG: beta-propeller fold lactonase family protein [Hydrotalea flava]|nr:beta-propeller fold lactonase family protein [Hydrotalea flava]NIM38087.1 beta-propeller fold lactonase family protein [Hydrotalea flava]NIN03250.1 beta-propeller fold lactonase family protein [Hydrotalea flava]NIN14945.1 beta-propeller fold lactonase family protein [Hydrotalea flava]NIO94013.1 beta-propeller fold lactonase family protein [Hydrotalea flava]